MTWRAYTEQCELYGGLYFGKVFGVPFVGQWDWVIAFVLLSFLVSPATALMLAFSIVAHEYGHILVGRRYGLQTKKVKLWLLGGMAEMEAIPRAPKVEFWTAIAGPLVSLALAVTGLTIFVLFNDPSSYTTGLQAHEPAEYARNFSAINTVLFLFNLIPALPMDGGRIYRAALQWRDRDYLQATKLAATTARVVAVCLAAYGIASLSPLLPVIGFFVWKSSKAEHARAEMLAEVDQDLHEKAERYGQDDPRRWATICLIKQLEWASSREQMQQMLDRHSRFLQEHTEDSSTLAVPPGDGSYDGWRAYYDAHKHTWETG